MGVWVVAEVEGLAVAEASLEALGEAVELARPARPGVLAVADAGAEPALAGLAARGAGRVVLLERAETESGPEADAGAAAAWLAAEAGSAGGPTVVVAGHTRTGRAMAPVLADVLDAAIAPDAVAVRRSGAGGLEITRPAYGERLYASVTVPPGTPAVVTLRPGAIGVGAADGRGTVRVERHPAPSRPGMRTAGTRRVIAADPRSVDLREAERIVSGGRGVGGPEGFALLQELADLLGAAVGGSRVAVDLGWLPWERQIGLSGRSVAPQLYVACGISGASQHLSGIQGAKAVVAINADAKAPLLALADLAVVGDWRPIVTALIARLRARRPAPPASGA